MAYQEIPMLRCSTPFKDRLVDACGNFDESRYFFWHRVNWSYRFSSLFYKEEENIFIKNPEEYVANKSHVHPRIDDVYQTRLPAKQVAVLALKVVVHWLFRCLGSLASLVIELDHFKTYRKAYVDDIEQVFPTDQVGVLRVVYPFPLSIRRQWSYVCFLLTNSHSFRFGGYPYSFSKLLKFLWLRNVRSLHVMETKAQLLHAKELAKKGFVLFELSDEFDVGSLAFCRMLRRYPVRVVNSAHGVGTYMPIHSYNEFVFLTDHQKNYYLPTHECIYTPRCLNVKSSILASGLNKYIGSKVVLVFLSQVSNSVTKIILEGEKKALKVLAEEFGGVDAIKLLYKSHPNNSAASFPLEFDLLREVRDVNSHPGVIFVSFFSTCYIDPNFVGQKVLLKDGLIYPSLIYGENENILDLDGLIAFTHGCLVKQ